MLIVSTDKADLAFTLHPFGLDEPLLVLITNTPFAAPVPYIAAAAAPLITDIDSISSGLISFNLDC